MISINYTLLSSHCASAPVALRKGSPIYITFAALRNVSSRTLNLLRKFRRAAELKVLVLAQRDDTLLSPHCVMYRRAAPNGAMARCVK